ncbi:ScyD/ScyE family protein [Mangrovimonas sp. YM274]|uniref:ScyD/ScyE family protein n=1 Tax=Mangrovimonas sp. YM274 TaxID=3070660 RepID=UPI0027DB2454|nr:ScyD/ScyE family protein [Mangrovimonas sp. YM274]WMI69395.1 ScyD/ScyE family protein [Mangrovimonas sp. YM274]
MLTKCLSLKAPIDFFNTKLLSSIKFSFYLVSLGLVFSCSSNEITDLEPESVMSASSAKAASSPGTPQMMYEGIMGGAGSTIGPGGDLFVTETQTGEISRFNLKTWEKTTFASGLPTMIPDVGIGGAMDIAFIGGTGYVIVSLVGPFFGTPDVVGIYRIDGPSSFTVIADLGAFSEANPPNTSYFLPMGVQYAIDTYQGGLLVTDGHHNRVLHVTTDGEITEMRAFPNIVPTGLAISGNKIFMAEAGPIPHDPEDGKVVYFTENSTYAPPVASGASLLVDVEFGRGQSLFAISQGTWNGIAEGSEAFENTGALVKANQNGTFTEIATGLDRPTSLEIVKNTAYVVTRDGEIWAVENIANGSFGN